MAHPHKSKIKDHLRWRFLDYDGPVEDLTEFWKEVEELPDDIDGKDYKKIIKKLFRKNGDPDFDSYEKLTAKLGKKGKKKDQEAFQEWHTTMRFINKQMTRRIHIRRLKRERDERIERIKEDKEQRRADRENRQAAARAIAAEAIRSATAKSNV